MSISGASAAGAYAPSLQAQPPGQHKHSRHPSVSISDVDAQTSSAASAASSTGGKVDITA